MMHRYNNRTGTRAGVIAWLGVLAVLLFQVQLATHLNDSHSLSTEAVEHCEVCLNLDSGSTLTPSSGQSIPGIANDTPVRQTLPPPRVTRLDGPQAARAPPRR